MKRVQVAGSVVACVALLLAVKSPQASEAARQAENLVTDISQPLPGMPPVLDPHDIYSADRPGDLNPTVKDFPRASTCPTAAATPWT